MSSAIKLRVSHTDVPLLLLQNYNSRKEAIMDEKSKGDAMMVEHNEGNRRVDSHDSERTARDPTNTPVRLQNKRKAVV